MSTTVTEGFVWIVDDPFGIHKVAAFTDGNGMVMPMFTTERRIADKMYGHAKYVSELCGFPIELRHFELVDSPALDRIVPKIRGGHA